MNLEVLFNPPYLYYLLTSITALCCLTFFFLYRRTGNRLKVEILNPSQFFDVKKYSVKDGYKILYQSQMLPLKPSQIFMKGKQQKVYLNGATGQPIEFTDPKGEISELGSTWTRKEIEKYIKKKIAESKAKAKIIDTTPLIMILVMLAANLFMLFMIARRLGVF